MKKIVAKRESDYKYVGARHNDLSTGKDAVSAHRNAYFSQSATQASPKGASVSKTFAQGRSSNKPEPKYKLDPSEQKII